jgi:hypothetical protein
MIRFTSRSRFLSLAWALPLAAAIGCSRVEPSTFPTSGTLPSAHRHPDGVALDLLSSPPDARERASSEDALVTLRTPLGTDVALATIALLFQRIAHEDADGLDQVFTRDAVSVTAQPGPSMGMNSSAPPYAAWWSSRFHKLDYTKLAGETIYREAEVEIYRAEDMRAGVALPSVRAEGLGETDVVARIPIATARIGQERLLGDEMILWLRREGDTFKIYRTLEDFQLQ